jgi:hypothetical protein
MFHVKLSFDSVPRPAVEELIKDCSKHGMEISKLAIGENWIGRFNSVSGSGKWKWKQGTLQIEIQEDKGHFSEGMLRGGIRQLVEEAIERVEGKFRVASG